MNEDLFKEMESKDSNTTKSTPIKPIDGIDNSKTPDSIFQQMESKQHNENSGSSFSTPMGQYGKSQYDEGINPSNQENTNEIRAQRQGTLDKIGNDIVKFAGTTLSSLSGIVSVPVGLGSAVMSGRFADIYDNAITNQTDNLNKSLEENFPNYYTKKEQEASLISPSYWFTTNFLFDKIGKNLGYTVGAIGEGMATAKTLSKLANLTEAADMERVGKLAGQFVAKGIEPEDAYIQAINKVGTTTKRLDNTVQLISSGVAGSGEASIEGLDGYHTTKQSLIDKYKKDNNGRLPDEQTEKRIDSLAEASANVRFGLNVALLTGSDFLQFGKSFSTLKDEESRIGKTIFNPVTGLQEAVPVNKIAKIGKALIQPFEEQTEEQLQFVIEKSTQNYAERKYDNPSIDVVNNIIKSTSYGLENAYGTKEGWENGLLGFITGGISGIAPGSELRKQLKEIKEIDSHTEEAIKELNKYKKSENYGIKFDSAVRDASIQTEKDNNLKNGNKYAWKNNQFDQFKNYVQSRIETGKFDILKDELNGLASSSDEDFKNTFGIPKEGNQKNVQDYVNNLITQSENIKKIYDNINTVYGQKYNKGVTESLFDLATNIDNRNDRINKLTTRLATLTAGRVNFNPYDSNLEGEEINKDINSKSIELNKSLKDWVEDKSGTFQNPSETLANAKILKDEKIIEDLHKLHKDKIETVQTFKKFSTKEGITDLDNKIKARKKEFDDNEYNAFITKVEKEQLNSEELQKLAKVETDKKKLAFLNNKIGKVKADELLNKNKETKTAEVITKNESQQSNKEKEITNKLKNSDDGKIILNAFSKLTTKADKEFYLLKRKLALTKALKDESLLKDEDIESYKNILNYVDLQLEKLKLEEIEKPKEENQEKVVKEGEQPIASDDINNQQINLFLSDIVEKNQSKLKDGIIKINKNSDSIDFLLNKLKIGDEVTISIDSENPLYKDNKDSIENIPIKIQANGIDVGFANTATYLKEELNRVDNLLNSFTGMNQSEADDFFSKIHKSDDLLIQLGFNEDEIGHVKKVLYFGKKKVDENTKFNIQELQKSLADWKLKISNDLINGLVIRKNLGLDISKSLKTTIVNKSSGSVIFNFDSKGKPVYNKITDSFDKDVVLLTRRINGDEHQLVTAINGVNYFHDYSKNSYEKGEVYVGVPTAKIKEDGSKVLIPIQLKSSLISNSNNSKQVTTKVISLIEKIGNLLKGNTEYPNGYSLESPEINELRNELGDIIVINKKAGLLDENDNKFGDNKKLKINEDSIEFNNNGQHIEIWYKHRLKDGTKVANKNPTMTIDKVVVNYNSNINNVLSNQERATNFKLLEDNKSYKSLVTGKDYNSYKDYLIEEEILRTNVGNLLNDKGEKIGNINGRGDTPMVIHINSKVELKNEIKENPKEEIKEQTLNEFTNDFSDKYKWLYKLGEEKGLKFTGLNPSKRGNAIYSSKGNHISVTTRFEKLSSEQKERVIAHEVIHSLLRNQMSDVFKGKLKDFILTLPKTTDKEINKILKVITKDEEELVTYALTNPDFAKWLNSIKVEGEKKESKTLWGRLKDIILEALETITGKSKLDELNDILDSILSIESTTTKSRLRDRKIDNNDNLPKLESIESSKYEEIEKESKYKSLTTPGFTRQEEEHSLNIIANIFIKYRNTIGKSITLGDIKNYDFLGTKKQVIDALVKNFQDIPDGTFSEEQEQLIEKIVDSLDEDNSYLWNRVRNYIRRRDKIEINDEDISSNDDLITKEWNDKDEASKNLGDSINTKIKEFISTIPIIDPLSLKIDNEGNVKYNKDTNTLTGFAETLNFGDVYPYIYTQMIGSISSNEMMDKLLNIGLYSNPTFLEIRKQILDNPNLMTMWYSTFNKQSNNRLAEYFTQKSKELEIKMDYANKNNNSLYVISDEWINKIVKNVESKVYDDIFSQKYGDIHKNIKEQLSNFEKNKTSIIDNTSKLFNLLGIDIDNRIIKFNIENKTKQDKISKVTHKTKEEQLYYELFKDKLSNLEKYIKSVKANEKVEFNDYASLNELAELTQMFRIDKVINVSRTVNGASVYNVQNNNFLSQWFNYKKSETEEGKNRFEKLLNDYAKDPALSKYSNILNKLINDKKFRDNFEFDMYEGGKNLDINKGQEYTEINDSDWRLKKILWHIQDIKRTKNNPNSIAVPLLSLADKGVMYFVRTQKIPLLDSEFSKGKLNRESELWKAVYNTFLQEKERMTIALDRGITNDNVVKNYHFAKFDKFDNPILLDEFGKPTGQVYKFHNMDIIENGKQVTLNDIEGLLTHGMFIEDGFTQELNNKVKDFIDKFIQQEYQKELIGANKFINELDGKYNHIGSFNTMIMEYTLNNYIMNVEQGNLFFGTTALYKNSDDANKRAPQITAMGTDYNLEGTFDAVVINSIKIKSNAKRTGNEEIDNILNKYNSEINDASSLVRLDEYAKRLDGLGRLNEFKNTIEKLKNNLPVNELELQKFFNPLKEFYYSYTYDENIGIMVSKQVKNATVPLIPTYIKGTELELLDNEMEKSSIQQINVESAEKVGTTKIVTIGDKNGNIISENLSKLKDAKVPLFYKDLRLQLDVPDHIRDEVNKLPVQIKNIFNNIKEDTIYKVGTTSFTGKEIVEHGFDLLDENIKESSNDVLKRLGVSFDKNNNPIEDSNGMIELDEEKLQKILESEIDSRGLSDNFKLAIQQFDLGGKKLFNLPLYYSVMASKYESILTALFTNNVTNQKQPGGHASMVSGMFLSAKEGKRKVSELTQEAQDINKNTKGIQWSKEIINRDDYILRPMQYNGEGKVTSSAEVLLPAWSKKFFNKDGSVIDIDTLPNEIKTMIGYRIPMETKHSMIVFKVVGFMPSTMGSVIVLPNDFVTQSGADFDIDSIYMMQHNFIKKDGVFEKVEYDNSKSIKDNSRDARENRLLDTYMSILTNSEHYKEIINPSSFTDLANSKKLVEKVLGEDKIFINRYTSSGNNTYRNRGLEGRDLKGQAANRLAFLGIGAISKMYIREDLGIIQKYDLKDTRLDIDSIKERYKGNYKIVNNHIFVLHNKIGWTVNDDFKNILGVETSDYSSQMLANILDIIKDPTKNINTYHFNVVMSFPDLGLSYDEMTLFASQPILKELSEEHYESVSLLKQDKDDKKIIEKVKRKYQTELYKLLKKEGIKNIKSHNDSIDKGLTINQNRHTTKNDLGYIVDLPNFNDIENSEFRFPSKSDYIDMLKESIKPEQSIEYYKGQLSVLEMFINYKKTGQAFQDGIKAFSSDKLGVGPNISVTDDLESSIISATDYSQDKDKITKKQLGARLLINKEPATKKIYPKFFDKNSKERSSYKMLESYLEFSNQRAVKSLSTLFINRVPLVKSLIFNIKSNINISSTNKEFINRKVDTFVNSYLLNDLPFFMNIDKQKLLGIDNKYNLKLDITNDDNFEIFKELSIANKLDLVKQQLVQSKYGIEDKKYDIKNADNHIINFLDSKTSKKDIDKNGYETINFRTDGERDDYMTETFNEMWYGENKYLKDLAHDLVKYTYITNGLTYGQTSIGKIIPTNILMGDLNNEENPKGIELASHLRNKFTDFVKSDKNDISNDNDIKNKFYRQKSNWKNNDIVPFVESKKVLTGEKDALGKPIKDWEENKIKWYPNRQGLIIANAKLLNNNKKILNANTIKVNVYIKDKDKWERILFQKDDTFKDVGGINEGAIYYYPVTKLENFEYTDKSFLESNNNYIDFNKNYKELIMKNFMGQDDKYENIEKPFNNISEEDIDEQIKKCN